jgi:carbamate kinase
VSERRRPRRFLLALGGNAIIPPGRAGTIQEQIAVTEQTMRQVVAALGDDEQLLLTHGNGPIVGNILIRNEAAACEIAPMPLDVCGADSQGGLGYMIQQVLRNELRRAGKTRDVVSIVTQVRVDAGDAAFKSPTKPIGPFYSQARANELMAGGWRMVEDAGRGYRRVVPSPQPREVIEAPVIRRLLDAGVIVIAAGGGGIPVLRDQDGNLRGVEAVIDKDRASALLAHDVLCSVFVNVTGVDRVATGFGTEHQRDLEVLPLAEARRLLLAGEFPPGSMGPKIEAAIEFLEGGGDQVLITSPAVLSEALAGRHGTRVVASHHSTVPSS